MFMNEYEIERAKTLLAGDPITGPASRLLYDLMQLVNSCSDGWAYWQKPRKAAAKLMALVQNGVDVRLGTNWPRPGSLTDYSTKADLRAAIAPIKAFMTREAHQLGGRTLDFSAFGGSGGKRRSR